MYYCRLTSNQLNTKSSTSVLAEINICDWIIANYTLSISRNTKLKHLSHCGSIMLDCSLARFTSEVEYCMYVHS